MNEAMIKNIIDYKLSAARKLMSKLPPKVSEPLKDLGKIVLESINESSKEIKNQPAGKAKQTNELNNIKID